jgi:hypothetical protein
MSNKHFIIIGAGAPAGAILAADPAGALKFAARESGIGASADPPKNWRALDPLAAARIAGRAARTAILKMPIPRFRSAADRIRSAAWRAAGLDAAAAALGIEAADELRRVFISASQI